MSKQSITKETAVGISMVYREIEAAEKLLKEVQQQIEQAKSLYNGPEVDVRDVLGRRATGLSLGVPRGHTCTTLFEVSWDLAEPVIQAYIAKKKAELSLLNSKAMAELNGAGTTDETEVETPK